MSQQPNTKLPCYFCHKDVKKQSLFIETFNKIKLCFFACNNCIETNTFYNTYFIKSNFILEDKYLKETKFLFNNSYFKKIMDLQNSEHEKLYLESDILNLIKKQHKQREKNDDINQRRNNIKKQFENLQLNYTETNDIYDYIYYGKSDINDILTKYLELYNHYNNQRYQFLLLLQEKNLNFHEKMLSYQKYLKKNYSNIDDILNLAELENKLINKTNYLNYIENLDNITDIEDIFNMTINELPKEDLNQLNLDQQYIIDKEFYLE